MRSAWAGGLHLRSRTDEKRAAGMGVNAFEQSALIHDGYERTCHATPGPCSTQTTGIHLEALLVSVGVVALAEFGDKTQLLALVLAARFRAPVPIIAGVATATLVNHSAVGAAGTVLAAHLDPAVTRWLLAAAFLAAAVWALIPDRGSGLTRGTARCGAYGTTVVSFFLTEMGDKTQFATMALAVRYHALVPVVAGTTLGMLVANVPVVLLGDAAAGRLPLVWIRRIAAALFVLLAVLALTGHTGHQ